MSRLTRLIEILVEINETCPPLPDRPADPAAPRRPKAKAKPRAKRKAAPVKQ